jgi:hypothetical protein
MKAQLAALTISLLGISFMANAADKASIDSRHQAHLTVSMTAAIKQYDAKFRILEMKDYSQQVQEIFSANEAPMAVIADFNRDGIVDAVVMGVTGKSEKRILAVISKGKVFVAQAVDSLENEDTGEGLNQYLTTSRNGSRVYLQIENMISFDLPLIKYIWENGKFIALPN